MSAVRAGLHLPAGSFVLLPLRAGLLLERGGNVLPGVQCRDIPGPEWADAVQRLPARSLAGEAAHDLL